ncbi:MAG: hypothetical protein WC611_06620 [Candidatus Neomarinimicrobiota bacterium]|jgi:hypothetical protein
MDRIKIVKRIALESLIMVIRKSRESWCRRCYGLTEAEIAVVEGKMSESLIKMITQMTLMMENVTGRWNL